MKRSRNNTMLWGGFQRLGVWLADSPLGLSTVPLLCSRRRYLYLQTSTFNWSAELLVTGPRMKTKTKPQWRHCSASLTVRLKVWLLVLNHALIHAKSLCIHNFVWQLLFVYLDSFSLSHFQQHIKRARRKKSLVWLCFFYPVQFAHQKEKCKK